MPWVEKWVTRLTVEKGHRYPKVQRKIKANSFNNNNNIKNICLLKFER